MFEKKPEAPDLSGIRELLFGDVPLHAWVPSEPTATQNEPWRAFQAALLALRANDGATAVAALRAITGMPGLESRQYLQAWYVLRGLGVEPSPSESKRVLGVVLEVHLDVGLDTLAAYADDTARYINHSGKLIVWDSPEPRMSQLIGTLLRAGQTVANEIGVWEEARRPPPPPSFVRLNMLTPSGLHFGEGPMDALGGDPMGGPVLAAGAALMSALIDRAQNPA